MKINRTLILIKKEEEYTEKIFKMIKEYGKKVCYVTFNKTPDFITKSARKYKIPKEKFYFVDCITARIKNTSKSKNVVIIDKFDNLKDINKKIKMIINRGYSLVIFDSLSNILIYPSINDSRISQFSKEVIKQINTKKGKVIFVCSNKDIETYSLNKTVSLFNNIVKSSDLFGS